MSTFTSSGVIYTIVGTSASITGCVGANIPAGLTIPSQITNGGTTYPVTNIDQFAFSGITQLNSVVIPNSMISIQNNAFQNCTSLTSVTLGTGLTTIASQAFSNTGLKSFIIPDNVTTVGSNVFDNCLSLTSITIGSGITTTGNGMFSDDVSLNSVTFAANSNCQLINNNTFNACKSLANIIIPNSVKKIGVNSFNLTGLTSVTIPDSVTSIEDSVFYNCLSLTSVTLGTGLLSIGASSFYRTPLRSVTIPSSVTNVGMNCFEASAIKTLVCLGPISNISNQAFYGCASLTSVTLSNDCTKIAQSMFNGCTTLSNITIPNSVTNIVVGAFDGTGLTNVTIPNSVTSIEGTVFYNCLSLTSVTLGTGLLSIGNSSFYSTPLRSVVIPNSVTSIGETAFQICRSLTSVTLGTGLLNIGTRCFDGDTLLTGNITIPSGVTNVGVSCFQGSAIKSLVCLGPISNISNQPFNGCASLTSVTLSNDCTKIAQSMFNGCTTLSNITIPNSVRRIYEGAFDRTGLTNVTIPNSVTTIESYVFNYCSSLTSVTLGTGLLSISNGTFKSTGLTSVVIPNSVTSIDSDAFRSCSYLTSATLGTGLLTINDWAFASTKLRSIIIPDNVLSTGQHVFDNCLSLTSATIGSGLSEVAIAMFMYDSSLNSVTFQPNPKLVSIGNAAFTGCSKLAGITLPNSVTTMGDSFTYCTSLTSITLPSSLTATTDMTFSGCTALTRVTIPSSMRTMNPSTFASCNNLASVYFYGNSTDISSFSSINFSSANDTAYFLSGKSGFSTTAPLTNFTNNSKQFLKQTPPTVPIITPGIRQAKVSWTAPSAVANTPSTGSSLKYRIAYYPTDASNLIQETPYITDVSYTITNLLLTPTNYTFRVAAYNDIGPSDFLDSSDNTLPDTNHPGTVTITGITTQNEWLRADLVDIDFDSSYSITNKTYQWQSSASVGGSYSDIAGATNATYQLTQVVVNKYIKCRINYTDYFGQQTATSAATTAVVDVDDPGILTITSSGNFEVGQTLTANFSDPDTPLINVSYQWKRTSEDDNSVFINIDGATSASYILYDHTDWYGITMNGPDRNAYKLIKVVVTYTDTFGTKTLTSNATPEISVQNEFKIYNVAYRIINGIAAVTGFSYYAPSNWSLTIPSNVNYNGTNYNVKAICSIAFLSCHALHDVTIPNSVTMIGMDYSGVQADARTFARSTNIVTCTLPDNIYFKIIKNSFFEGCNSFKSIVIPSSVTEIGAFNFPSNPTVYFLGDIPQINGSSNSFVAGYISPEANTQKVGTFFNSGSNLKYWYPRFNYIIDLSGNANITQYNNTSLSNFNLEIPATIVDASNVSHNVTKIADSAFSGCTNLTKVTITSNNLTHIGNSTFQNCSSLLNVYFYNSIIPIIGTNNFNTAGCTIYYINGSTNISNLSSFTNTPMVNPYFTYSIDSNNAATIYSVNKFTPRSFSIPGTIVDANGTFTVKYIAPNAFLSLINVYNIILPDSIKTIGDGAFQNCTSLTSITLGTGLLTIGNYAFNSTQLGSVIIPNSVTYIGETAFQYCSSLTSAPLGTGLLNIGAGVFQYCASLTNVTIPNSTTSIGNSVFYECFSLTSITLGTGLLNMGGSIFTNSGLKNVTIPNSVTLIGNSAFYNCASLTSVTLGTGLLSIGNGTFKSTGLTSVVIPNSVTLIDYNAFQSCSYLTSATLGTGLLTINDWAFASTKLRSIIIPDNVSYAGSRVFETCTSLTSVTIGSGLSEVAIAMFANDSSLDSVTFQPNPKLVSIGNAAFTGCSKLAGITLPNSVTTMGDSFTYCTSLTSITLPSSLTATTDATFYACTNLTRVTIPSSMRTMNLSTFASCNNLASVYFYGNSTDISSFSSINFSSANDTAYFLSGKSGFSTTAPLTNFTNNSKQFLKQTPPTGLIVTPGDRQATVSWTAPAPAANTPSTGSSLKYTVTYYPTNDISLTKETPYITDVSYTITNLQIGITNYTFKVTAYNDVGPSDTVSTTATTSAATNNPGIVTITGTVTQTQTLTASLYDFDTPISGISYQWQSSDSAGGSYSAIAGATNATYQLTQENVRKYVKCKIDYTDYFGATTATSGPTTAVADIDDPGSLTTITTVNGRFEVGQTLSSTFIDIDTPITDISYQWVKINSSDVSSNIVGATNSTLVLTTDSVGYNIYLQVQYTDPFGRKTVISNTTVEITPLGNFIINNIIYTTRAGIAAITKFSRAPANWILQIPSSVNYNGTNYNVTYIDDNAFINCTNLNNLSIGTNVTTIGNSAFQGCSNISTVTISNSVTTIGPLAFKSCTGLRTVNLGYGLTTLSPTSFQSCALTTVNYWPSLDTLGFKTISYFPTSPTFTKYPINDLKLIYTISQLSSLGYMSDILSSNTYSLTDLRVANIPIKNIIDASGTIRYNAIKDAGYTLDDLQQANYNTAKLKTLGVTESEISTNIGTVTILNDFCNDSTDAKYSVLTLNKSINFTPTNNRITSTSNKMLTNTGKPILFKVV